MFSQCSVRSATLRGCEAVPVSVEVVVCGGLPGFSIVGMPDAAIQEARERVRAAVRASGFSMPSEKIVVNLAPGALKKTGSGFDLPMAVGILVASGQLPLDLLENRLYVGELSLQGAVKPVAGVLAYALCARDEGVDLVCAANGETVEVSGVVQLGMHRLRDFTTGDFEPLEMRSFERQRTARDFSDIAGHESAKRALQIAAAGNHGILMMGPPGSGKTMLASRLVSILPPLSYEEALESFLINSIAGEPIDAIATGVRPFRAPHHSATLAGLVGGGTPIRPGEISLAHNGVLFLDEIAEFKPTVLQGIRQPLESGEVRITRADGNILFPARFMLVAAANPCPCGYFGDSEHSCTCTVPQIRTYQNKIGGPLMDRIDIHIDVNRIPTHDVISSGTGTSSAELYEGVERAREFASWRQWEKKDADRAALFPTAPPAGATGGKAALPGEGRFSRAKTPSSKELIAACRLSGEDSAFLEQCTAAKAMSGRAIMRVVDVARTIADIDESLAVGRAHLHEAMSLRLREGEER